MSGIWDEMLWSSIGGMIGFGIGWIRCKRKKNKETTLC